MGSPFLDTKENSTKDSKFYFSFLFFPHFLCNQTEDQLKPNEQKQELNLDTYRRKNKLKSQKKNKSREHKLAFSSIFDKNKIK